MVDLTPFLHHLPAWLMVVFRLTGMFILAPMYGSETIPRQIKVFLVLVLSLAVYPALLEPGRGAAVNLGAVMGMELTLWSLIPLAALELLVGFVIGYGAMLPLIALQSGGQIINQQMGLGIAGVFNPEFNEESGSVAQALFLMGLLIFLLLNGHLAMVRTLIGTFDHVPVGGLTDFHGLKGLLLGLIQSMMEFIIRVSAPILTLLFLESVAMGFITRTVPQMNILSVGFIIRIMMTVGVLMLMVSSIAVAAGEEIMIALRQVAKVMADLEL